MKTAVIPIVALLVSQSALATDYITAGGRDQSNAGSGFSTDKKEFRGSCLTGEKSFIGQNIGYINFSLAGDKSLVSKTLGIEGNARYKFSGGSASAGANFLKSSEDDNRSIVMTFIANYAMQSEKFTATGLSNTGQTLKDKDDIAFLEGCGDEYVEQVIRGANLLLNIRIDFSSESDKRAFSANASYNSSVASAYAAMKDSKDTLSKRTKVKVEAIQIGGDTKKLGRIFRETNTASAENGTSNFIKCSFGELDKCEHFLSRIQEYVATELETQLTAVEGQEGGPAHLQYVTKKYINAGILNALPNIVNETIIQKREEIDLAFNKNQRVIFRARNLLLEDPFPLSDSQRAKINKINTAATANEKKLVSAAISCYDDATNCVRTAENLFAEGNLTILEEHDLVISPEMYRQFCYEGKSPRSSIELSSTIHALIELAKVMDPTTMTSKLNDNLSECDNSYTVFLKSNTLDTSLLGDSFKNKIYTLEPLMDLTHLTKIKIANQNIRSLEPLVSLKRLRQLDLSNNDIRDIHQLAQLTELEDLNLAQNKVRSTDPLNKLLALERIDIRNNLDSIACPTNRSLKICKKESYMRRTQMISQATLSDFPIREAGIALMDKDKIFISREVKAQILNTTTNIYDSLPDMLFSRIAHTATTLEDGRVLIVGGVGSGSTNAEIYDPVTKTFTVVPRLSQAPRAGHQALRLNNGKVLFTGGWEPNGGLWSPNNASPTAEIFDPDTGTIKVLPYMSNARLWHQMTLLKDGTVLISGGYSPNGGQTTAEIYDPNTETFELLHSPMTDGRAGHTASLLPDGKVLIAGGIPVDSLIPGIKPKAKNSLEIYDPIAREFTEIPDTLRYERAFHTAAALSSGHVVFIGGAKDLNEVAYMEWTDSCKSCIPETEIFNPSELSVSELPSSPLTFPRAQHTNIALNNNKVVVLGGRDSRSTRTVEVFAHTIRALESKPISTNQD
jgi:hypothetical protein